MRDSWDEIRRRARAFSADWRDAHYEKGETQSFYDDLFTIFGVKRRTVASHEQRACLLANHGFMDLFWRRALPVEQKSARLDLDRADVQALDHIDGLPPAEQPRHVLTCDFQTWRLLDLETGGPPLTFALADLHKHVEAFAFVLGRQRSFETQAADTPEAERQAGLPGELDAFPYVSDALFAGYLRTPTFDRAMRSIPR